LEYGFDLSIIFSPDIGVSKSKLRAEFIVAFMSAAEEFEVKLAETAFLPS